MQYLAENPKRSHIFIKAAAKTVEFCPGVGSDIAKDVIPQAAIKWNLLPLEFFVTFDIARLVNVSDDLLAGVLNHFRFKGFTCKVIWCLLLFG